MNCILFQIRLDYLWLFNFRKITFISQFLVLRLFALTLWSLLFNRRNRCVGWYPLFTGIIAFAWISCDDLTIFCHSLDFYLFYISCNLAKQFCRCCVACKKLSKIFWYTYHAFHSHWSSVEPKNFAKRNFQRDYCSCIFD